MHLMSVDLPAPLSPSRERIWPKRIVRSAPRSASRWPNRFQMLRHSIATLPCSRVARAVASDKLEHLHPPAREELDAVFEDARSVLPARPELGRDDEGIDLEGHVLGEWVLGRLLHPRRLDFDQPEAVAGAVEIEVVAIALGEVVPVAARDLAREDSG